MNPERTDTVNCFDCASRMKASDNVLRCRINGLPCSTANAYRCSDYRKEDADEQPWFAGGWCADQGRGD